MIIFTENYKNIPALKTIANIYLNSKAVSEVLAKRMRPNFKRTTFGYLSNIRAHT